MAYPVWGLLSKAQDDPQTILAAIAALIDAHKADDTAHLGANESLQSHRASDIIDHLARSVYRDKLAFDRFQIDEHFATIDAWTKSARVSNINLSSMLLETTNSSGDIQSSASYFDDFTENQGYIALLPIFETRVKFNSTTFQKAYIFHGDIGVPAGFGFKIINNTLYAVYYDSFSAEITYTITGVTLTNWNLYRVEVVSASEIKFFVNGVLKYTSSTLCDGNTNNIIIYTIETTSNTYKIMGVQSLHYDEDYSAT